MRWVGIMRCILEMNESRWEIGMVSKILGERVENE